MTKLSPRKQKALAALLEAPNQAIAARNAGIAPRTMRAYIADPDFQAAYKQATAQLVADATRRLQQATSTAIDTLEAVASDPHVQGSARVSAASSILSNALRFSEFHDVLQELRKLEGDA